MTIAEFAEELRVRPVTVRSWITKGKVTATRSGQRKWLIRRSELGRMLKADGETPIAAPPPPVGDPSPIVYAGDDEDVPLEILEDEAQRTTRDARARLESEYAYAVYEWDQALQRSVMAPPDARFASRIRQIARAASAYAANLTDCVGADDFVWTPIRDSVGMTLSYELRPGGPRPGPQDGWARFDRIVARLGDAMAGTSPRPVIDALRDLANVMTELASAIETRPAWRPSAEQDG